jgi:hypothetical protein
MITSNPGAEFTRKTTIIVALGWLQREKGGDLTDPNGRFALQQAAPRHVIRGSGNSDRASPVGANWWLCGNTGIRQSEPLNRP